MPNPTVGAALANAVADRLQAGRALCFSHPEYCGMGLHCADGLFIYCEVTDGELLTQSQYLRRKTDGEAGEFLAFAERDQFVAWLAGQSDLSLSGLDLPQEWLRANQRLSLARLRAFLD
ncbi:MAG TPA: hypothetical protein DCW29_23935 [Janthinobacterium sp.]|nr:hypothetical protein [Janthinobacterium sp.]